MFESTTPTYLEVMQRLQFMKNSTITSDMSIVHDRYYVNLGPRDRTTLCVAREFHVREYRIAEENKIKEEQRRASQG